MDVAFILYFLYIFYIYINLFIKIREKRRKVKNVNVYQNK